MLIGIECHCVILKQNWKYTWLYFNFFMNILIFYGQTCVLVNCPKSDNYVSSDMDQTRFHVSWDTKSTNSLAYVVVFVPLSRVLKFCILLHFWELIVLILLVNICFVVDTLWTLALHVFVFLKLHLKNDIYFCTLLFYVNWKYFKYSVQGEQLMDTYLCTSINQSYWWVANSYCILNSKWPIIL